MIRGYTACWQISTPGRAGRTLRQCTRGYNADSRTTYLLRDKENDAGYRYFPDPDLLPLRLPEAVVAPFRAKLPELPAARRARRCDFALGRRIAQTITPGDDERDADCCATHRSQSDAENALNVSSN